jgi:hypothetical protein
MHCWTWPNLLFWSVIPEHAARHSFPLCPGIAGLAALAWIAWLRGKFTIVDWGLPLWSGVSAGVKAAVETHKAKILVGLVVCWLLVKLAFVNWMIPQRNPGRKPRATGEQIAAAVPPGQPLYLFRLKDEGILFYFGRKRLGGTDGPPARRLSGPEHLLSHREPMYCILDDNEWRQWQGPRRAEVILDNLVDEQKAPIWLVRVLPLDEAPSPHSPSAKDTD